MTCNLAIAITKAALADEHLIALMDGHLAEVTQIMAKYLHRRHPRLDVAVNGAGLLTVGDGLDLQIEHGQVNMVGLQNSRTAQYMTDLVQEASAFLTLVADQLFAREVERTLGLIATLTGKQISDVENAGSVQRAMVFSLHLKDLKARVFVLPERRLQVFIDNGTFVQAKAATQQLLQGMQVQGLGVQVSGEIEQHRDDMDHVHVRQAQQRGGRS